MKIPYYTTFLSAPLGLYPLKEGLTSRVRINEATYNDITSRIFSLYDASLFSVQAWLMLRKETGEYVFHQAMRRCGGEASYIPHETGASLVLDFVEQQAVQILIEEILSQIVVVDRSCKIEAGGCGWKFVTPTQEAIVTPLRVSQRISRAGVPQFVYAKVSMG